MQWKNDVGKRKTRNTGKSKIKWVIKEKISENRVVIMLVYRYILIQQGKSLGFITRRYLKLEWLADHV